MKKQFYTIATLLLLATGANAQVGIGTTTPHASSSLDITSTTSGLLKPRMTTAQRTAITTPATGLEVFDTTTNSTWFFNGTAWINNAPITADLRIIGTRNHLSSDAGVGGNGTSAGTGGDNIAIAAGSLGAVTTGTNNIAIGYSALAASTTGIENIAIGKSALQNSTTGPFNVAIGSGALQFNTSNASVAIGYGSLAANTSGTYNIAYGTQSLNANISGSQNTGVGYQALYRSTSDSNVALGTFAGSNILGGGSNTAIGASALSNSTSGVENTAIGFISLINNTTGSHNTGLGTIAASGVTSGNYNTGVGYGALSTPTPSITGSYNNGVGPGTLGHLTSGTNNNAFGYNSLLNNTTGSNNTGYGAYSMNNMIAGNYNTALGLEAWYHGTGSNNVAVGFDSGSNVVAGDNNVSIGTNSLATQTSGSNNIALGYGTNLASTTGSNQMNLGNIIFGGYIDGSGTGGNVTIGHNFNAATNGYNTLEVNGTTRIVGALVTALYNCPINTSSAYQVTVNDCQRSIFYLDNAHYMSPLTLPSPAMVGAASTPQPGQILKIINQATSSVVINGTNTDNSTGITLVSGGSAGIHAVEYVWTGGTWVRIQ